MAASAIQNLEAEKKNTHTPKLAKTLAASAIQNLEAEKKNTHTPKLAKTLAASAIQNLEAEKKTHTHIKSKIRQTSLKAGAKTRVTK